MLVGMVSAKGSPGVTTCALAVTATWPRPAVMVEADPFGGDVRAGLGVGEWPPSAGLAELVVDLRSVGADEAMARRSHQAAVHAPAVLAGLGRTGQAPGVPWLQLAAAFRSITSDVVADCGRFMPTDGVAPLLAACDVLVVVTRSSLSAVRATARLVPVVQQGLRAGPGDPRVSVLVVGPGEPYGADEVAQGCALPLLGAMPEAARAAAVWSDGAPPPRGFARSGLQRAARAIGVRLTALGDSSRGAA